MTIENNKFFQTDFRVKVRAEKDYRHVMMCKHYNKEIDRNFRTIHAEINEAKREIQADDSAIQMINMDKHQTSGKIYNLALRIKDFKTNQVEFFGQQSETIDEKEAISRRKE